jgi:hypothetical protein
MSATTQANAVYHRHQYGLALLRRDGVALLRRDGVAVTFHRDAWKYWSTLR